MIFTVFIQPLLIALLALWMLKDQRRRRRHVRGGRAAA